MYRLAQWIGRWAYAKYRYNVRIFTPAYCPVLSTFILLNEF
ncbi:MAG: hypothetical protein ACK5SQ_03795 [Chitinophagales bacterium]